MQFDLSTDTGRAQAYASSAEGAALVRALESSEQGRRQNKVQMLRDALVGLLDTAELNMDDLEPQTRYMIENAQAVLSECKN